jgi:hypothetical protein
MKDTQNSKPRSKGDMDQVLMIPTTQKGSALFSRSPKKAMAEMREIVQIMASQCTGTAFISEIRGKQYPKVEWWTTIGATLGLFPVVMYSRKLDRTGETAYEARVEVRHGNNVVAAGEALCSSQESHWKDAPEYSIKSMAITRATGKAYRIPLSFLAVMAGLAPTNAEEIPIDANNFNQSAQSSQKASVKQLDYIFNLAQNLYGEDAYRRIGLHISINLGKDSGKELTRQEASDIIECLLVGNDLSCPEDG